MADKRFYKTKFTVTVLSEYPLKDGMLLDQLNYLITDGDCSGEVAQGESQPVSPKTMARLLEEQGSDPAFFGLEEKE